MRFSFQCDLSNQLDDNLGEVDNFQVYDLSEENGLDTYMSMEVPVSEGEAKEDIILMLQRMMNYLERDPDMKVKILQERKNMF